MKIRKKDELIPLEKAERVIRTEKRGRSEKGKLLLFLRLFFDILGGLCILYCLGIALFVNFVTRFFLVWGAVGILFLGAGWLAGHPRILKALPRWLKMTLGCLLGVGLFLLVLVEGLILNHFWDKAPDGADYVVILGAQIREDGPSDVLRRRLDAALAYLGENPETKVIVSGGQGSNEPMTEAEGMRDYLLSHGVEADRILLEDASRSTRENLENSGALMDPSRDGIVLVTNNFHVFRALSIARRTGYEEVYGLAADSYPLMLPNNMLREFLGVVKDFLTGNM